MTEVSCRCCGTSLPEDLVDQLYKGGDEIYCERCGVRLTSEGMDLPPSAETSVEQHRPSLDEILRIFMVREAYCLLTENKQDLKSDLKNEYSLYFKISPPS